ncbi:unnamed protein product, partial [Vitis vinifera]|uniref:Uncharacterized protein n=1 Tax=Vitis vinifera TaxID=29760 RepID=E0CPY2_VITVI
MVLEKRQFSILAPPTVLSTLLLTIQIPKIFKGRRHCSPLTLPVMGLRHFSFPRTPSNPILLCFYWR